jgi:hypothetical protein
MVTQLDFRFLSYFFLWTVQHFCKDGLQKMLLAAIFGLVE